MMTIMYKLNKIRLFPLVAAIIWTIGLSFILLQPENQAVIATVVPPAPPSLEREILFSSLHIVTFGFTAIIWCFAFDIQGDSRRLIACLVLVLLAFGLTVEYLQSSIPGRSAQWWDMLANCIGISIGIWVWVYLQTRHFTPIRQIFG